MPSPSAMQVLSILRQSLRKRDRPDKGVVEDTGSSIQPRSKPRQPTRTPPAPPSKDTYISNDLTTNSRASTFRLPSYSVANTSSSRVSHPPLPPQGDFTGQDFTLSLDYHHVPAEVRIADILQRSWLNFCLQKNDLPSEGAVLVAAGESAKSSRRMQSDTKEYRRRRASSLEVEVAAQRPILRHAVSTASVSKIETASIDTVPTFVDASASEHTGTAPLRLKPKRSMPQLEGVWEDFLVETAEDVRTLTPTEFDQRSSSTSPHSSTAHSLHHKSSSRSLYPSTPSSPKIRLPRHSPSAPSLSALSAAADLATAPPASHSGEFLDDLISFYSAEHASRPGPLRRKSGLRRHRATSPIGSLRLSASTLQALVPDASRQLDDDSVDPILPSEFSLDQFPSPPDHRRILSRTSERSFSPPMSSSRTSSVSSIATAVTPTTVNFPATPPLSRSSSRSTPASILKKPGRSSPSSSPVPTGKQLSKPHLANLASDENLRVHFDKDTSRGLISSAYYNVSVINGDHAELQAVPEPRSPPVMRRHLAMPSDASSSEEADATGDMVFYPQSPRTVRRSVRVDVRRPPILPAHVPVPNRPTESKPTNQLLPAISLTSSPTPRPKSEAPGLWRRKMHSESSAMSQYPPVISSPRPLARPRPLTVVSDGGRLQVNASSKSYFQAFSSSSDPRTMNQRFVKPVASPIGVVQYGYAF